MNSVLPAWVVDDQTSVRNEAAPYRRMSPEQRAFHMALACRAAAKLLLVREDRQRVLDHVDPLPDSAVSALARLRRDAAGAASAAENTQRPPYGRTDQ